MSRTKNTLNNIKAGSINKIITLVLPFFARTILIKTLGAEYAGLSSLFVAILSVLNLAELGIGTAITFSLYKPTAEEDIQTVRATMNLYKRLYRVIGIIVLVVGLALMPFLSYMIKGDIPGDINLSILYLIYLLNTVLTYWLFAYKTILLEVHQKNNIVSNINTALYLIQFAYQMIVLICFKNYYLYIVIMPFVTVLNNIIGAFFARKLYPQYYCKGELSKEKRKDIRRRVYGLMIQKLCATARNSFDSIFISAFLGLSIVAIYNNYYMIMSAITGFVAVITIAMTASVGNSVATESMEKNYNDMMKIDSVYMFISGICAICLLCLYQPFMKIWLGDAYLLDFSSVILLALYFYVLKMGDIRFTYMQGAGLWWEGKYRAIAEAVLNIVLDYALGKYFGINGIIIATIASIFLINFCYGSTIIFKHYFVKKRISEYFSYHLRYFIITLFVGVVVYWSCGLVRIDGLVGLIIKAGLCLSLTSICFATIYRRNHYYLEVKRVIKRYLNRGASANSGRR